MNGTGFLMCYIPTHRTLLVCFTWCFFTFYLGLLLSVLVHPCLCYAYCIDIAVSYTSVIEGVGGSVIAVVSIWCIALWLGITFSQCSILITLSFDVNLVFWVFFVVDSILIWVFLWFRSDIWLFILKGSIICQQFFLFLPFNFFFFLQIWFFWIWMFWKLGMCCVDGRYHLFLVILSYCGVCLLTVEILMVVCPGSLVQYPTGAMLEATVLKDATLSLWLGLCHPLLLSNMIKWLCMGYLDWFVVLIDRYFLCLIHVFLVLSCFQSLCLPESSDFWI